MGKFEALALYGVFQSPFWVFNPIMGDMPTVLPGSPVEAQLLGYAYLIEAYALDCPPPRRMTALLAIGQKTTTMRDGVEWVLLSRNASYRVPEEPIEHLTVALKHEGVDLRVLSQLFVPPALQKAWFLGSRQIPAAFIHDVHGSFSNG